MQYYSNFNLQLHFSPNLQDVQQIRQLYRVTMKLCSGADAEKIVTDFQRVEKLSMPEAWYECRRRERLGAFGGMPPRKFSRF